MTQRVFLVPGAFKLDHLHPFKPLLFWKISIFFTFMLGGQFLLPQRANKGKGNLSNPKSEWDRGFSVLGAFKLGHLHPFKPILFWTFSTFFTFMLGGNSCYPQRSNNLTVWGQLFHLLIKRDWRHKAVSCVSTHSECSFWPLVFCPVTVAPWLHGFNKRSLPHPLPYKRSKRSLIPHSVVGNHELHRYLRSSSPGGGRRWGQVRFERAIRV